MCHHHVVREKLSDRGARFDGEMLFLVADEEDAFDPALVGELEQGR